jgi:hypothetical protein
MSISKVVTFPVQTYHTFEEMQMWGFERIRLLKNDPWDATDLAQELYAMDLAANTDGTNLGNGATTTGPITTNDYVTGDTLFQVNRQGQQPFIISLNSDGQFVVNEQPMVGGGGGSAAATSFPGQIVSGSGNSYVVAIYALGLSQPPRNVNVTQLEIDPGDAIPAGSWATVSRAADGTFFMQVPVWL